MSLLLLLIKEPRWSNLIFYKLSKNCLIPNVFSSFDWFFSILDTSRTGYTGAADGHLQPCWGDKVVDERPWQAHHQRCEGRYRQDDNGMLPPTDSISNLCICGSSAAPSDISCDSSSQQESRMKEAVLRRKIQEKMREEHENHIRWSVTSTQCEKKMVLCLLFCVIMHIEQEASFRQVHLGEEPVSEKYRRQLAEEQQKAQQKYTVRLDPDVLNTINLHGKKGGFWANCFNFKGIFNCHFRRSQGHFCSSLSTRLIKEPNLESSRNISRVRSLTNLFLSLTLAAVLCST